MKFLFAHRNFPAQFKHILIELAKNPSNEIIFITGTKNDIHIKGVKKLEYRLKRGVSETCHRYLRNLEECVNHGQAAAELAIALRNKGFKPDLIYAHPWGNSMFFKDVFPNVPMINYCEWYYNSDGADIGFAGEFVNDDKKAMCRCKNAQILIDLAACDKGICPTEWQKSQYPKEFHHKIEVIHDGIDTKYFVPNNETIFKIPNNNIELTTNDEVVTYATRGMEPYRGFPQFMEMAEKLLKRRPNTHVIIGGEDRVCYGAKLKEGTFKELMLKKLDLDMSRIHFAGALPYIEYKKLLQISSVHVYLTYPFVLSWSLLEAMSIGCCVVASKTTPVEEVIKDKKNGFLVDFYDIDALVNKVEYVLEHPDKVKKIRENARKTIVEKYDLHTLLPKVLDVLYSMNKI